MYIHLIGGASVTQSNQFAMPLNTTFLNDIWSWRIDITNEPWRQDNTGDELFISSGYPYRNNSPSVDYVTPNSPLEKLVKWWTPDRLHRVSHSRLVAMPYITADEMKMLHSVGLYTITDLANADKYTILKLRGFDIPQVPKTQRYSFDKVCDVRALAQAVVQKCTVDSNRFVYDGEANMPWNSVPLFGGAIPRSQNILWHNTNYTVYQSVDDPITLVSTWDGCSYINLSSDLAQYLHGPNVPGLGFVDLAPAVSNPLNEIENLFCRWNPGPRAYMGSAILEDRLYLFGGKSSEIKFNADTWYRDPVIPQASFNKVPSSKTSQSIFEFTANKPGCYFEYRIWMPQKYKEIVPWTAVVHKTDVNWLSWRKGGPGNGWYTLYVRAVDPAGNRDIEYSMNVNVYNWYYTSPVPLDIILGSIGAFLFILLIAFIEYRRRIKKAAMERYAMKRMRRKFKAMKRELDGKETDWRKLYLDTKNKESGYGTGDGESAPGKKSLRERKLEKRDKEMKRKNAEKEKIRNKLNAAREFKG